jgi:hypothetical protein
MNLAATYDPHERIFWPGAMWNISQTYVREQGPGRAWRNALCGPDVSGVLRHEVECALVEDGCRVALGSCLASSCRLPRPTGIRHRKIWDRCECPVRAAGSHHTICSPQAVDRLWFPTTVARLSGVLWVDQKRRVDAARDVRQLVPRVRPGWMGGYPMLNDLGASERASLVQRDVDMVQAVRLWSDDWTSPRVATRAWNGVHIFAGGWCSGEAHGLAATSMPGRVALAHTTNANPTAHVSTGWVRPGCGTRPCLAWRPLFLSVCLTHTHTHTPPRTRLHLSVRNCQCSLEGAVGVRLAAKCHSKSAEEQHQYM